MSDGEEPGSPPQLSADTAALLQQFLAERSAAEDAAAADPFAENWQLSQVRLPLLDKLRMPRPLADLPADRPALHSAGSTSSVTEQGRRTTAHLCQSIRHTAPEAPLPQHLQFWYSDNTAATVAAEVVELAAGGPIACVACPSLFRRLRADFPEQPVSRFRMPSPPVCPRGRTAAPRGSPALRHQNRPAELICNLAQTRSAVNFRLAETCNVHRRICWSLTSASRCSAVSLCTTTTTRWRCRQRCTLPSRSSSQTHPTW